MDSLEGHLLLASEQLRDPNFARAVVLLVEHNQQGALGVIINRPTSKTVRELWHDVSQSPCQSQQPVCLGGPVSGPLMAVHAAAELAELEVVAGVYFSAKKQHLDALVNQTLQPFKLLVGHAGWGPGQLEQELEQGAWLTTPATAEHVFDTSDGLWQRVIESLRGPLLGTLLGLKHIPADPRLN
jgi:putative transcriptional regulator